ncbi:hypothetical protein ISO18_06765 [Burkholderia pseudomultivorans]|nr:hypothetical protein [Burkholderia pseudomultivorans]
MKLIAAPAHDAERFGRKKTREALKLSRVSDSRGLPSERDMVPAAGLEPAT